MLPSAECRNSPLRPSQELIAFENEAEFTGTFNGAPGTYTCADDDCTLSTSMTMGELDAVVGTWYFTPDAGATSDVADSDFLSYGFWLKKTTKDGVVTYNEVETFATAEGILRGDYRLSGAVTGSASYKGGAVGVYVHNVLDRWRRHGRVQPPPATSRRMPA